MSLRAEWKCDSCGFSEMGKNMFASPPGDWIAIRVKRWNRKELEETGMITKRVPEEIYHCHSDDCTSKLIKQLDLWDVSEIHFNRYGERED